MDRECIINIDQDKQVNLDFTFNYQNTEVVTFDARIVDSKL